MICVINRGLIVTNLKLFLLTARTVIASLYIAAKTYGSSSRRDYSWPNKCLKVVQY